MPAKVILYIASTLDGYIATPEGGIDWLTSYEGGNHGYEELMARTGALAMGSGTYAFFDELDDWAYPDQPTWVFTSRQLETFEGADIHFTDRSPAEVIDEIREAAGGKDVWLVGGGILTHNVPVLHHLVQTLAQSLPPAPWLLAGVINAVFGIVLGLMVVALVALYDKLFGKKRV